MSNHNYQILDENEMGWISKCNCCGEIQVSLGTVLLHLPEAEFRPFARSFIKVGNCPMQGSGIEHPRLGNDRVLIQTPVQNLHLSFSRKEFNKLAVLLEMGCLMLDTQNILKK